MDFLGSLDFLEDRPVNKTTTMVLERCLRCEGPDGAKVISEFLRSLQIQPDAFFLDIMGDWSGRPFLGAHVFKVVKAAGYEGTEHDLWTTVTGYPAPYPVKTPKVVRPKKGTGKPAPEDATVVAAAPKQAKPRASRGRKVASSEGKQGD